MESIYLLLAALIVIALVLKVLSVIILEKRKKQKPVYHYKKKEFILTKAEYEFFKTLQSVVGEQYYVFPQMHLPTFIDYKVPGQSWRAAFRHIDEKSVDFVICDKNYLRPLVAIELDDSSHSREDRVLRDEEVERILKEGDLPLLRFKNKGGFSTEEVSGEISNIIDLHK
jgi:hypothetical protein